VRVVEPTGIGPGLFAAMPLAARAAASTAVTKEAD
jgi:hypothetical protein